MTYDPLHVTEDGTPASGDDRDKISGKDTYEVTGSDDATIEPETMLNRVDRSLTIGSVREVVVIPDLKSATLEFVAKKIYGDANDPPLAETKELLSRHRHVGVAAENACAKLLLCRTCERSCVRGARFTNNTADTINPATSEHG